MMRRVWLVAALGVVLLAALAGAAFWPVQKPPRPRAAALPASVRVLLTPRKDSLDLTVAPQGELDYRVGMQAGATLVYAWSAAPTGEKLEYEFAGREKGSASAEHSAFVAQSSGWYRWRWRNPSSRPVTIHLKLSGYYEPLTTPPVRLP
jgi:hypothetical protein